LWVASVLLAACGAPTVSDNPRPATALRYVALGDSYTIGTSVEPEDCWPAQLVDRLGDGLVLSANLAVNGFTTHDVIVHELPDLDAYTPDFVSLLIGVNDVVRGEPEATYRENVAFILDDLLGRLPPNRILIVATPDYTVTPAGAAFPDAPGDRETIARFNEILEAEASERGIAFVPEIYAISQESGSDPTMVADDGLHPSAAQYALWVDAIEPVVAGLTNSP
jgi:lysophospholipase L1-like esterase